jgi:hypothetical protein
MKRNSRISYSVLGLAAGIALVLATGCGKQEQPAGETGNTASPSSETAPTATQTPSAAVNETVKAAKEEAQKTADAVKASAAQVQSNVTSSVQETASAATVKANAVASEATSQVQALIDKAKGYVTDEKYKDALNTLQQLSSVKLTDEQQKLVDSLKEKIQAAMASTAGSNAASALNNILGGKK